MGCSDMLREASAFPIISCGPVLPSDCLSQGELNVFVFNAALGAAPVVLRSSLLDRMAELRVRGDAVTERLRSGGGQGTVVSEERARRLAQELQRELPGSVR